jgi:REP element-mobilizing transposase RayT
MRVEYEGAIYHLMSRGDRGEDIFLDDVDRHDFLKTLGEACLKTGWQVHAYCLMRNHYHLVIETPNGNLVSGMAWLQSTYTNRLNHRHKLFGHVFSGRYKSQVVDGSGNGYLRTACDYVHLNPVRARLLRSKARLMAYPWSSLPWYLSAPAHRPKWMRVDRLMGEHGLRQDSAAARREFEKRMEARRSEESDPEEFKPSRLGWNLGSEPFRVELLERMEGKLGEHHSGELRRGTAEPKAARLRRETTLSIKEIAAQAHLGKSKSANARLHRWMKLSAPEGQKRHETEQAILWVDRFIVQLRPGSLHLVSYLLRRSASLFF